MRIGIVAEDGAGRRGGVETYARDLVSALSAARAGEDEVVRLAARGRRSGAWLRARRALHALLGWAPGSDPVALAIDRQGLDVVHYPATEMPEFKLRTPAVLTFFDMQEELLPGHFRWRDRQARRVARRSAVRRARAVIVPSRYTGECLRARYGTPEERLHQVPPGVGAAFSPEGSVAEAERIAVRYGLPHGPFLLYPANPWPHKNHERLFAAVRAVREAGTPLRVVCTGRLAGERRSVAALASAAGLGPDAVTDAGFVDADDMPALYRAARALVFPSLFEGFGLPVLEAMACGCPVACASIPPLEELGGAAVRLFDPLDLAEIAAALRQAWGDEPRRRHWRAAGLERAQDYRWPRLVARLMPVYALAARGTAR